MFQANIVCKIDEKKAQQESKMLDSSQLATIRKHTLLARLDYDSENQFSLFSNSTKIKVKHNQSLLFLKVI